MKDYKIYLRHIHDEACFIISETGGLNLESFISSEIKKRAFVRSIEIMGEAAKNIPDEIKILNPEIDWRNMCRTRDRLIHAYFGINYHIIWDIVINEIPRIKEQISKMLDK